MDSILSCGAGVVQFLAIQPKLDQTGYEVLLQLLAGTTHTRAKVSPCGHALESITILDAETCNERITIIYAVL